MSSAVRLLRLFQWFTLVVALNSVLAQQRLRLLAGDRCPLPNGAQGVCRALSNCASARNQLRRWQARPETERQPVLCGFSGTGSRQVAVVCCDKNADQDRTNPTRRPPLRPTVGITNPSRGPFTPTRPAVAYPTRPTVGNPTRGPLMQHRMGEPGLKSMEACLDLTNEIEPSPIPLVRNGVNARRGQFPHMALIGYASIDDETVIMWDCGGALISHRYVLTAAHCVRTTRRSQHGPPIRVRLGEHNLMKDNDGEVDFGIARALPHPGYNLSSWYHDIALIQLDKAVVYSSRILPACLYTKPVEPASGLIITGWGTSSSTGGRKAILQMGRRTLESVPAAQCDSSYRDEMKRGRLRMGVTEGMFCALDSMGEVDSCKGDSGGPLQVAANVGGTSHYHVVGVTSAGPLCAGRSLIPATIPGIYTRVYNYLDWIEDIVWPS